MEYIAPPVPAGFRRRQVLLDGLVEIYKTNLITELTRVHKVELKRREEKDILFEKILAGI